MSAVAQLHRQRAMLRYIGALLEAPRDVAEAECASPARHGRRERRVGGLPKGLGLAGRLGSVEASLAVDARCRPERAKLVVVLWGTMKLHPLIHFAGRPGTTSAGPALRWLSSLSLRWWRAPRATLRRGRCQGSVRRSGAAGVSGLVGAWLSPRVGRFMDGGGRDTADCAHSAAALRTRTHRVRVPRNSSGCAA